MLFAPIAGRTPLFFMDMTNIVIICYNAKGAVYWYHGKHRCLNLNKKPLSAFGVVKLPRKAKVLLALALLFSLLLALLIIFY